MGVDASAEVVESVRRASQGVKETVVQLSVADVFGGPLPTLPTCDCVFAFNEMHRLMESEATLAGFFSNAFSLLKENGVLAIQAHDGAAIWYSLTKETPEEVPADYRPHFKRKLFSASTDAVIKEKMGVRYRFRIKSEKKTQTEGFLINSSLLNAAAYKAGFDVVNSLNCGEMYEMYRSVYGEAFKKKATSSTLMPEQKEFVDMFQMVIFKKKPL